MKTETYCALVNTKTNLVYNETRAETYESAKAKADYQLKSYDFDWSNHVDLQIKKVKVTVEIVE